MGLVLGGRGAAAPGCAGDTVYDSSAPTLEYGWSWRRAGMERTSSQGGLGCANRENHGFTLARESWTAS